MQIVVRAVGELYTLCSNDVMTLSEFICRQDGSWARSKFAPELLEVILQRWEDPGFQSLTDEVVALKDPDAWKRWVEEYEKEGVDFMTFCEENEYGRRRRNWILSTWFDPQKLRTVETYELFGRKKPSADDFYDHTTDIAEFPIECSDIFD
jgi:hypothetical protein